MSGLKPWTFGPFELLLHAEMHRRDGNDMDRRIAMISFDNAIEVAISTYLQLHPSQRGNRQYSNSEVEQWLKNYHTRLDFLDSELQKRKCQPVVDRAEIIWFHDVRNDQYHGGKAGIPEEHNLSGIRKAALWIFGFLFEIADIDGLLDEEIHNRTAGDVDEVDRHEGLEDYLDDIEGPVSIAGTLYSPGDVLRAVDPISYQALKADLEAERSEEHQADKEGAVQDAT